MKLTLESRIASLLHHGKIYRTNFYSHTKHSGIKATPGLPGTKRANGRLPEKPGGWVIAYFLTKTTKPIIGGLCCDFTSAACSETHNLIGNRKNPEKTGLTQTST
jgi:hypothetical protein